MSETTAPSEPQGGDSVDAVEPPAPMPYVAPSWHTPRMLLAWAVAVVCGALVLLLVPAAMRFHWFALAVGFCTLVTFALQLGTAQREGFITRTSFSVAGCVLIIGIAYIVNGFV